MRVPWTTTDHGLRTRPSRRGFASRSPLLAPRRSAISLTEVLIAMGIMTVGLLGVASVFPVGSWYARKADIADQGSAIAQSAMNDLVTRGLLNPQSWMTLIPSPTAGTDVNNRTAANFMYLSDGKYTPASARPINSWARPLAESMADALKLNPNDETTISRQFGNAYVIDPMAMTGIAATTATGAHANHRFSYGFPASSYLAFPGKTIPYPYYNTPLWATWKSGEAAGKPTEMTWPIRRVTFRSPMTGWQMTRADADAMFRASDDLAYDFPQRADRPSIQSWDTVLDTNTNKTIPLARKWTGDYSWIATVAPATSEARDLICSSPASAVCTVSVAVLYKRAAAITNTNDQLDQVEGAQGERSVGAKIKSTGLSGGEILLWDLDDGVSSAFTNLKVGNWIMLCGPHPNTSDKEPRFVLNWYQVQSVDSNASDVITNPEKQRLVTVRGPQWPWQPRLSYPTSQQGDPVPLLSDDLCVGIIKGAVAVHAKTMTLESQSGFTPTGLGSAINSTTTWGPH